MAWMQFSHGIRLDPTATKLPEALVVLLHDFGGSAAMLTAKLARWATMVPATAFVALDGVERPESATDGAMDGALANGAGGGVAGIARAAQDLELLVDQQLRSYRLGPNRLVLAGFGYGGGGALRVVLFVGVGRGPGVAPRAQGGGLLAAAAPARNPKGLFVGSLAGVARGAVGSRGA